MRKRALLSSQEAGLLWWAATEWPVAGPVLELGSFEGAFTAIFALGGRYVYAVDAWGLPGADLTVFKGDGNVGEETIARFWTNMDALGVADLVSVHRGLTHEVGRQWVVQGAILFVDASHAYDDVKGDLDIWTPHLHPEGLLLMRDVLNGWEASYPGVTRAASELLHHGWQVVASSGTTIAFIRKHLEGFRR